MKLGFSTKVGLLLDCCLAIDLNNPIWKPKAKALFIVGQVRVSPSWHSDIWDWITPCCRICPVHFRTFSSSLAPSHLMPAATPPPRPSNCDTQKCLQSLSEVKTSLCLEAESPHSKLIIILPFPQGNKTSVPKPPNLNGKSSWEVEKNYREQKIHWVNFFK